MRVLLASEMRCFDRWAIETVGIPSLVLMENAATGVVDAIAEHYPDLVRIGVLCGPGNNGGDGLAIARLLEARGYICTTLLAAQQDRLSEDALRQLDICRALGIEVSEARPDEPLAKVDLWVDALFGTGLSRPLEGEMAEWVKLLDRQPAPVVAVDLPSGLDASRAEIIGPCVSADLTVALAAPKVAHVLLPAAQTVGLVCVADLGVAYRDIEESRVALHLLLREELALWLVPRERASHKGDYGHALLVAGSTGMSGAAVLAARAAHRAGVGLVSLATPHEIRSECAAASSETMVVAVGSDGAALGPSSLDELLAAAQARSAVAIGPGLGRSEETSELVRLLASQVERPLVIDADGLNAFAGALDALHLRRTPAVLTPHPGELARLLGQSSGEIQRDRVAAVRTGAARAQAVMVLKGDQTLIAEPGGQVWINSTGNPGMATGGSGDVLTGVIVALLARGFDELAAAHLGVFLHGLAGDLAADRLGEEALIASDLIHAIPEAWRELAGTSD